MPSDSYRHTQLGWPMLIILPIVIAIPAILLAGTDSWWGVVVIAVIAVVIASIFATLTVSIDESHLRLKFGVGIIRRAFALDTIRGARIVRNPWYAGTGIRVLSRGWLYNVSGSLAVEIDLPGDRIARIGTDEPAALLAAIHAARADLASPASSDRLPEASFPWSLVIPVPIVIAAGVMIYVQARPPAAEFVNDVLRVSSGFYSSTIPVADIEEVIVADSLPAIESRTNGFAMGESLRGRFRLRAMGRGSLYVNRDHPPYVIVRTKTSFVIIGFEDPARTQRLIAQLARVGRT